MTSNTPAIEASLPSSLQRVVDLPTPRQASWSRCQSLSRKRIEV